VRAESRPEGWLKKLDARANGAIAKRYARAAVEPTSAFGLIRGLFEAIKSVLGIVAPKLELTYQPGRSPYFETDEHVFFAAAVGGGPGPVTSTVVSSQRRWFRVGIKNRSIQTVEGVRVELASIDPPVIGHLPLPLSIMHGTQQPLTVHRANEPTYFADVVLKLDDEDQIHIMSTVTTPRSQGIPAGRYRLGIRVTGRNTPAVTKHYVADVDDQKRLVFAQD